MKPKKNTILSALAIVLLTILAYLSALNAGFIWDDDVHVTQNYNLRSAEGLSRIWFVPASSPQYYPIAHTLFWIEYQTWGLWAAGDHAVNIALHATNALLLWLLLKKLRIPGAWLAALLFSLHPVQVETVVWIMESKTLLSTFFYFLALLSFIRFWQLDTDQTDAPCSVCFYWIGFLLFILSLLSKSVTATLPAVLLLILWWKRGRLLTRDFLLTLPLFAIGALAGIYTAILERTHVGAEGAEWALTPIDRILIAGRALWFYAAKLVWPHPLIFFYERWNVDASAWWQYLFPIAAVLLLVLLWLHRQKLGRGPFSAVLFFILTLGPALGFLNFFPMRYSFVADHFQYLACVGLITLFAALLCKCVKSPPLLFFVTTLIAAPLFATTFLRTFAYHDALSLYQDIVVKNPDSWGGQALLASAYQDKGDYSHAVEHFAEAARLKPEVIENIEGLGAALVGLGRTDEAISLLTKVIDQNPARAKAYNDLAAAYMRQGNLPQAAALYQEAIRRDSNLSEAHFNLGDLLARTGQFASAEHEFLKVLVLRPEWPEAALYAARCIASQGKLREALPYFQLAVRLKPEWPEARSDLARIQTLLLSIPTQTQQ